MHSTKFWEKVFSVWLLKDATHIVLNLVCWWLVSLQILFIFYLLKSIDHVHLWISILSKWKWQLCQKYSMLSTCYNNQWKYLIICWYRILYYYIQSLQCVYPSYFYTVGQTWEYSCFSMSIIHISHSWE